MITKAANDGAANYRLQRIESVTFPQRTKGFRIQMAREVHGRNTIQIGAPLCGFVIRFSGSFFVVCC